MVNNIDLKLVTCTGYYNTGSSAVGDFLRQFEFIQDFGDIEIRIAHEPDGLADLEYNIVENNHRHNTSNAIKRFLRLCKYYNGNRISKRYRTVFGNKFFPLCSDYIDSLVQLKCKSWWQFDQLNAGPVVYFIDVLYSRLYKKVHFWKDPSQIRATLFFNNEKAYFSFIDRDLFYKKTRQFTSNLIDLCWDHKSSYLVLDQLVPPTNLKRYMNYFKNLKTIVVDRDPRDVFLLEMENPYGVVPTDVKDFCKWYSLIRQHRKFESLNNENTLFINFEDMIYDYNNTACIICSFLEISYEDIISEFKYFDPKKSIKNTRKWVEENKYDKDVKYIENHLSEYLYDYGKVGIE